MRDCHDDKRLTEQVVQRQKIVVVADVADVAAAGVVVADAVAISVVVAVVVVVVVVLGADV